jgi:hypothetical protein
VTSLLLRPASSSLPLVAWFIQWWVNAWPVVPTLIVVQALDRRASIRLIASYVIVGLAAQAVITLGVQLLRGSFNTAPLTNAFWMTASLLWTAWLPLVLLVIVAWRRIRAVMPVALAATLIFGFALIGFHNALLRAFEVGPLRSMLFAAAVVSSADVVKYGLFMIVSLPVGWIAWRLLRRLASAFDAKRFSDVQLVIDCWWVVVTAEQVAVGLSATYGVAGLAGGLAAFVAYRVAVALMLGGVPVHTGPRKRLLLLRVFGYQSRTERLFDRITQRWRFHGPVQLIAGVDLATRTADPGDMLAFIQGDLAGKYVAAPGDVSRRLERLDLAPDPDTRFRVNEVYCHSDTWRPALEALLDASDAVLMDLRTFSEHHAGCIFELRQLVTRVPTDGIVLVCDRTTDLRLLDRILREAWTDAQREGRARGTGEVTLVRVERQSKGELDVLLSRLLGHGEPGRRLAPTELAASLV